MRSAVDAAEADRHQSGDAETDFSDILKKTEQSQRVLEEASEGFQIIREDEATGAEETLTIAS